MSVGDHGIYAVDAGAGFFDTANAVLTRDHHVPGPLQDMSEQVPNGTIVLDQKDGRRQTGCSPGWGEASQ